MPNIINMFCVCISFMQICVWAKNETRGKKRKEKTQFLQAFMCVCDKTSICYVFVGEDFLTGQPDFFTETAVTPNRKVEKWFPRWEINRHAEG